jgi:hypothetical protein
MNITEYANQLQQTAQDIIEQSQLVQLWEAIGAEVHIVGSFKTGLLIHKDIDIHIYTGNISISDSFSVMAKLTGRLNLSDIQFRNLIETEEECIEWHALFQDKNSDTWKLDIIHIRKGSAYDGAVEKVTDAIKEKLTPEIRETILQIKYDMPKEEIIPGIEVYHAVFDGKVKTYGELLQWRKTNPLTDSLAWMP